MQSSHSRIECFESCPYKYKMRYCDKILTLPSDAPNNPLIIGQALHTGLEKGVAAAIQEYYMSYPIITDTPYGEMINGKWMNRSDHISEAMKLEALIPKAKALIPKDGKFEVKISNDHFVGYIDFLTPVEEIIIGEQPGWDGVITPIVEKYYDLYDFKYSNNVDKYRDSKQLHLYKYFWEKEHPGKKIRNMYFLFVPKVNIKQKKTESLYEFRSRLSDELSKAEPQLIEIPFDMDKVIDFLLGVQTVLEAKDFPQNEEYLCNWCEYQAYCQKGNDYMLLPNNERRTIGQVKRRKMWIYGAAFSGKTTMLDDAPNPLNLNTDGNVEFVTMPYIPIKDDVTVDGRRAKRTFAWDIFKDAILELEKQQNDFKTIIVDLLEDTREMCRIKMYDDLGIQHESDSGYGKGWDIIKTEYLSTIRRLFNLPYENIVVVSHEDISKDIAKKNGQNITRIAPNIQDAIANKIAGMVDIVARVVVDDDGTRTLNFKSNEVIFGGGRLKGIRQTTIPLSWAALMQVYDDASGAAEKADTAVFSTADKPATGRKGRARKETPPTPDEVVQDENEHPNDDSDVAETTENQPEETTPAATSEEQSPSETDEKPVTRTRRKRGQ